MVHHGLHSWSTIWIPFSIHNIIWIINNHIAFYSPQSSLTYMISFDLHSNDMRLGNIMISAFHRLGTRLRKINNFTKVAEVERQARDPAAVRSQISSPAWCPCPSAGTVGREEMCQVWSDLGGELRTNRASWNLWFCVSHTEWSKTKASAGGNNSSPEKADGVQQPPKPV